MQDYLQAGFLVALKSIYDIRIYFLDFLFLKMRYDRVFVDWQSPGYIPDPAAIQGQVVYLVFHPGLIRVVGITQLKTWLRAILIQTTPTLGSISAVTIFTNIALTTTRALYLLVMSHEVFLKINNSTHSTHYQRIYVKRYHENIE